MTIRLLALALLAGSSLAFAAPPKPADPKTPPQDEPASIDVDAMARAKDEGSATPSPADAPPADAASPAETPPPEVPPDMAPVAPESPVAPDAPVADAAAPAADAAPAAAATGAPSAEEKSIAASCESRATNLLDDAQKADYGGATRDFDAKMRTALPPPKFKDAWESLARFGKLEARGQSHLGRGEGYTLVMIPLIFEKANLVAQVACGSDGRIAGFYVKPAPMATPGS